MLAAVMISSTAGSGVDVIYGGEGFDTIHSTDLADVIHDDRTGWMAMRSSWCRGPAVAEPVAPVRGG